MKQTNGILSFNKGLVSPLALAREDVKRVSLGASTMDNFIARVMGCMAFRPGRAYLGNTNSNLATKMLAFVHSTTDTALIELTNLTMRIWVNDALVTRNAVSTAITNGTFTGNISGWTTADNAGCTSSWAAGNYLSLLGNGTGAAITYQLVTVAGGDLNVEQALRVVVAKGFVNFRVGSTLHGDDYFTASTLGVGTHSLAITPTGNYYVELRATTTYASLASNCTVEAAGTMTIPTPWLTADLGNIRAEESVDIMFVACSGYQQQKIERRGTHSWSVVNYEPQDGPFGLLNTSITTIASSAITGDITLTASQPLFYSTHVGGLFSLSSVGQDVTKTVGLLNDATNSIQVEGVGANRVISISITSMPGANADTITLQQSFDNAAWVNVQSWTANTSTSYNDGLANQIIYYRLICTVYASGAPVITLAVPNGAIYGTVKITAVASSTSASASVLIPLGGTAATSQWEEGLWSNHKGWPTAVRLHEGRMWWFGKGNIVGSISDNYYGFNENTVGDSGPINITIGSGPVDTINWALSGFELTVGAQGAEISCRSDALGAPLTPTNFNIKIVSTQGSAPVEAVKVHQSGYFVQRGGTRIYQLSAYNPYTPSAVPTDLTALVPELGLPGIVRMAIQMQPDTRVHAVRSDGTVMLGVFDANEGVLCWQTLSSPGLIKDVVILPGQNNSTEDQVYYVVNYTINSSSVTFLEKWAIETDCRGGTLNKQADAFVTGTQAPSTTISGLSHLIGQSVVCWHDGICEQDASNNIATFVVSGGGTITVGSAATSYVVGLPYTGQWQSTKLGEAINGSPALLMKKNMARLGFVAAWLHSKGIQYGNSFTTLYDLPAIENGTTVNQNSVWSAYDQEKLFLEGGWSTDMRLCLQAQAPRPATIMGIAYNADVSP